MILGVVTDQLLAGSLSLVAALVFAVGLALQQKGNLAAMRAARDGRAGGSALLTTVRQPVWIAGFAFVGLFGFGLFAVALRIGSLVLVQTLQVTQMIFTVPLSAWVARVEVRRREWEAAVVLVVGLALVIATLAPEPARDAGTAAAWTVMIPILLAVAALFGLVARRHPAFAAAALGAACGTLFGLHGAVVKEVTASITSGASVTDLVGSWAVWAAVVLTPAAVLVQNLALRAGRLSAAQTAITTSGPVVSAAIGLAVFGESLSVTPVRLVGAGCGAVACAWGISQLARSPSLVAAAG